MQPQRRCAEHVRAIPAITLARNSRALRGAVLAVCSLTWVHTNSVGLSSGAAAGKG